MNQSHEEKLAEASFQMYVMKDSRTRGGLPGPSSIYEHAFLDGLKCRDSVAHRLVSTIKESMSNMDGNYMGAVHKIKVAVARFEEEEIGG